jgi:Ca2+-binding RTX toxin-like protein
MIQVTLNDVNAINKLSISTLNAPPGSMFQTYFLNEMINGASIVDVTHELIISSGFQAKFPDSDANSVFATKFIAQLVGNYTPADGGTWAINHLTELLDSGMTRPQAVVAITNDIDAATNADPHWGLAADLFHNRVVLSSFYSGNPAHATDVDGMNRAMAQITADPTSILLAESNIDIPSTTVSIIGSPVITEGGNAIYTISRSGDLSVTTTVDFTLTGTHGADSSDFGAPSDAVNGLLSASSTGGTIVFPAFTSMASFIVPITSDKIAESGEKLTVALVSNPIDTFSLLSPTQYAVNTNLLDVAKNMKLNGNSSSNVLTGNNGNDVIKGLGGNDILTGGEGKDKLAGGSGHDVFKYLGVTEGGDTITDFNSSSDVLQFSQAAFGTVAALSVGTLTADHLLIGDHKVTAETHTQQFIYDTASHNLYFDADASSGIYFPVLVATFTNNVTLAANNLALIA